MFSTSFLFPILIIAALVGAGAYFARKGRAIRLAEAGESVSGSGAAKIITVPDAVALKRVVVEHAAKGFTTIRDDGNSITLSQKKPFNWVLAIVLLFIPIIGWIALIAMILAGNRGNNVVEITLSS